MHRCLLAFGSVCVEYVPLLGAVCTQCRLCDACSTPCMLTVHDCRQTCTSDTDGQAYADTVYCTSTSHATCHTACHLACTIYSFIHSFTYVQSCRSSPTSPHVSVHRHGSPSYPTRVRSMMRLLHGTTHACSSMHDVTTVQMLMIPCACVMHPSIRDMHVSHRYLTPKQQIIEWTISTVVFAYLLVTCWKREEIHVKVRYTHACTHADRVLHA